MRVNRKLMSSQWTVSTLVFLVTVAVFSPFARREIDPHHDGLMLKTALDILDGKVLFRETFSQYGTVTAYLQAFFLWLLGPTLYALKWSTVLVYALIAALFVKVWTRFLPPVIALLGYLIWLSFAPFYRLDWALLPWSSVSALLFQAISLLCLVKAADSETRTIAWACLSGATAAVALWCRLPVGLLLFFALTGFYVVLPILSRRRQFTSSVACVGGFLAINALFFVHLTVTGALRDWYLQVIVTPGEWLGQVQGTGLERILFSLFFEWKLGIILLFFAAAAMVPSISRWRGRGLLVAYYMALGTLFGYCAYRYPSLTDIRGGWSSAIPMALLVAMTIAAVRFIKGAWKPGKTEIAVFGSMMVALASWAQYYPVMCFRHFFWGITPAIGPALYLAWVMSRKRQMVVCIVMLAMFVPLFLDRVQIASAKIMFPHVEIDHPDVLRGMLTTPQHKAVLERLANAFDEYRDVPILVEGTDALYATMTRNLRNPGPLFVAWNFPAALDAGAARENFLREARPLILVDHHQTEKVRRLSKEFKYANVLNIEQFDILVPVEARSSIHR